MARSGLSPLSKFFGVGGFETLMRQQGRRTVCVCPPERERLEEKVGRQVRKRFSEVQLKFQRFRSPSNLEPRLARALRELRGVEEATCLLELASDDPEGIEGQLKHCTRFYHTLADIKGEVESIIKSGRKLVEDKAVPDPQKFTTRIDTLKELYNKLGSQITDPKVTLNSALGLSQNCPALSEWINNVEVQLDEFEGTEGIDTNLDLQVAYLKKILEEDIPKWNLKKESIKSSYKIFSGLCDPVYLEVLKERVNDSMKKWEKLNGRLKNVSAVLENATAAKSKLEQVNCSMAEINQWLNEIEKSVHELDALCSRPNPQPIRFYLLYISLMYLFIS
ncbi:utrophin-like [Zootermopsis nevadensis]|uniref:utrophin-like n=1 Tax=Zootermopsis nevadensis TaxID=136037 RepID=UPI000B8E8172|nr:utrophin-like [Zootermopsis nevadensis]